MYISTASESEDSLVFDTLLIHCHFIYAHKETKKNKKNEDVYDVGICYQGKQIVKVANTRNGYES